MEEIEYDGFIVSKTNTGFRVTRNDGSDKHTHLKNKNPCFKLIDNVNRKRIPKRCGAYYIESHIRLSDDKEYTRKLEEYLAVKLNKGRKEMYYNPHKKKF